MEYEKALNKLIADALAEDIGEGDHSTLGSINPSAKGKAVLKIKDKGILAGVKVAEQVFRTVQPNVQFNPLAADGDSVKQGDIAFEVLADVHTILKCERLALNIMQRMTGIATLTHTYVEKIKNYHATILDTRKTTPNFRLLEKEAVKIGGGQNHRMGLYDMIMLKDNHIDYAGGIENALQSTFEYQQKNNLHLKVEIETRNIDDVKRVVAFGKADRIMLDNFTPEQISEALDIIQKQFETEASGGISLDTVEAYAATGVDYISVGAVIHHAVSADLSLKANLL